jgi:hypothetical protein
MKQNFIFFFLLAFTLSTQAQKTLTSGKVKMEITDVSSDDAQMAAMADMIKGTESVLNFNETMSVTKVAMMGGMMQMQNFLDHKSGESNLLMNMGGQKIWMAVAGNELKKKNEEAVQNMIITPNLDDKKNILGYDCHAINVSIKDAVGMSLKCYITKEIKAATSIQGYEGLKLDGFPLLYIVDAKVMKMTVEAKEVSEKADETAFTMKTDGYKKMTEEEMKSMFGGAMGF